MRKPARPVYSPTPSKRKTLKIMALTRLNAMEMKNFVAYMIDKGMLKPGGQCKCGGELVLKETETTKDGFRYKCSVCKNTASVRAGSLFAKSKMTLKDVVGLTHCFIPGSPVTDMPNKCGISTRTATEWFSMLHGLIKKYMEMTQKPIGGHHLTAEADEVSIGHLTKVA